MDTVSVRLKGTGDCGVARRFWHLVVETFSMEFEGIGTKMLCLRQLRCTAAERRWFRSSDNELGVSTA